MGVAPGLLKAAVPLLGQGGRTATGVPQAGAAAPVAEVAPAVLVGRRAGHGVAVPRADAVQDEAKGGAALERLPALQQPDVSRALAPGVPGAVNGVGTGVHPRGRGLILRVAGPVPPHTVVEVPVRLGVPRPRRVVLATPAAAAAVRGHGRAIAASRLPVQVKEVRGPRPPISDRDRVAGIYLRWYRRSRGYLSCASAPPSSYAIALCKSGANYSNFGVLSSLTRDFLGLCRRWSHPSRYVGLRSSRPLGGSHWRYYCLRYS